MRASLRWAVPTLFFALAMPAVAEPPPVVEPLPGTAPLTWTEPLDERMRQGVHAFLEQRTAASVEQRAQHWHRDVSSPAAYERSIEPNRKRLARSLGVVDARVESPQMLALGEASEPRLVAQMPGYTIHEVRWPALPTPEDRLATAEVKQADWTQLTGPTQIDGEGLLLQPRDALPRGYVIVLPDADQTPELLVGLQPGIEPVSHLARRLVENGFTVIVPTLLSRQEQIHPDAVNRRSYRDWIYTPAFEVGRHPIGYEVQKVLAAVDWCMSQRAGPPAAPTVPIAVAGYGEGGLIAFYSAALDPRIAGCLVSGYFGPRQSLWTEPLHRNVWGLLREFGDAEIATLIAPRALVVQYSPVPEFTTEDRNAGPGKLTTPSLDHVKREFERIEELLGVPFGVRTLVTGHHDEPTPFGSPAALSQLAELLGVSVSPELSRDLPTDARTDFDPRERQQRLMKQMENYTQLILRNSEYVRDERILSRLNFESPTAYEKSLEPLRRELREEHIGWLDEPLLANLNPRTRKIYDEEKWTGYDVVIDVWPGVFAWGVLCVPKDIQPGERRPVVVCQHGLEGLPESTIEAHEKYLRAYKAYAAQLAERGFITFAPHNLYRGGTDFRLLQRKANPLRASLFSIITAQHSQILNYLETLPFVDGERIAFYGLSYGGKSAMRIPALETRYCLSICSGDFNEWVRKNADLYFPFTYAWIGREWEMPEWDLGHSFNYAEMTYLICPRPFMVERGHHDGVGIDPWIAYEFARARRPYDQLGIGAACEIEYFDGPHAIHLVGTAEFLHRYLNWPAPQKQK